jgi:hypothetical protein
MCVGAGYLVDGCASEPDPLKQGLVRKSWRRCSTPGVGGGDRQGEPPLPTTVNSTEC